jgi:hypothetical protein
MLRHACGYALAKKGHDIQAIQGWLGPSINRQHCDLHRLGAEPQFSSLDRTRY